MLKRFQDIEKAIACETRLREFSGLIAAEFQKPFSCRDSEEISKNWSEMKRLRPQLEAFGRSTKFLKRPNRGSMSRKEFELASKEYREVKAIKKRLRLWKPMEQAIELHKNPKPIPLIRNPEPNPHGEILSMLDRALHSLSNTMPQNEDALAHGCFSDIPVPILVFDKLLSAAYRVRLAQNRERPVRFLDVGCGGGTKVFAATRYFPQADGLEYDEGYARAAVQTLAAISHGQCQVIQGDALTFEGYDNYDVIYLYRPLQKDELLAQVEARIQEIARPGTIVIALYSSDLAVRMGIEMAQVDGPVFVTGATQEEADQLRKDAEMTGTEIVKRASNFGFDTGFWAPMLDAASFNG